MFIWDFVADTILGQIVDWIYGQVMGFLGNFFAEMGNMGVELFELSWVQSIVLFFSYLAWALYVTGLVVACFECGIEYSSGRGNLKETALCAIKGFMAVSLFTVVPIRLYELSVTLQASLTAGITGYGTSIGEAATEIVDSLSGIDSLTGMTTGSYFGFASITSPIMLLFCIILMAYAVIKVFFANLKRGGILLIQIAVGSLYMFSVPRGYTDGFIQWCKQIIGLCLTAFLQSTILSETMAWWGGPSCVIHNSAVTGESVSVIAQAGQTYRLTIPAVNEYVLAHTTIKNPTAATRIDESPDGAITVTYKLPAAADDKTVNGAAVSITPPAYGVAPDTTATVAGTAHCTASAVTWNPTDAAFGEKIYTATVTLTADTDYTFANDAVFTINGYKATDTKNADDSVTLSYTFPALTEPHTHTYSGSWVFATPDTHIRYCTANDGSYEEAPHSITSWTDKGDGKTHTGTCTDCGYEKTENHSWEVDHEVPPTVTAEGTRYYKCSACAADKTESIPKLIEYSVTVNTDGNGTASADHAKAVAGTEIKLTAKADSGYHFKEWQVVKGGMTITNNKFTMPDEAVEIMAIFEKNASTGTGGGGGVTTYSITVKSAKNGDVTASHKSASKGTTVTLTVDPDKGYVLDTLTVLDDKDKEIKLTEKNGKYVFTMPSGKVTVAGRFKVEQPAGKHPFTDIPSGAYYENAVIWAADKGITGGTSATTFAPNGICTRAQAVTFLWRAAGSPAPKSMNSFADVPADAYYAKAVAWAVENGITSGTGGGKFSPDATCTRAQIVTFLYRAAGSPAVSGGSVFSDVKAGAYYADAVTWAANKGITGGIGNGLFGSDNNCTRAQIVTFLYRYME